MYTLELVIFKSDLPPTKKNQRENIKREIDRTRVNEILAESPLPTRLRDLMESRGKNVTS